MRLCARARPSAAASLVLLYPETKRRVSSLVLIYPKIKDALFSLALLYPEIKDYQSRSLYPLVRFYPEI